MMLPAESFSDAVSFLVYYDLGGLKLASKAFSFLANKCADAVRLFDFSDFKFYIYPGWIYVHRRDSYHEDGLVCRLELTSDESLVDFIPEAFRNCTVGRLYLMTRDEHILRATRLVAHTITITDTLSAILAGFENEQELVDFVNSFRRVNLLKVWQSYNMNPQEKESLQKLCQRKGIAVSL